MLQAASKCLCLSLLFLATSALALPTNIRSNGAFLEADLEQEDTSNASVRLVHAPAGSADTTSVVGAMAEGISFWVKWPWMSRHMMGTQEPVRLPPMTRTHYFVLLVLVVGILCFCLAHFESDEHGDEAKSAEAEELVHQQSTYDFWGSSTPKANTKADSSQPPLDFTATQDLSAPQDAPPKRTQNSPFEEDQQSDDEILSSLGTGRVVGAVEAPSAPPLVPVSSASVLQPSNPSGSANVLQSSNPSGLQKSQITEPGTIVRQKVPSISGLGNSAAVTSGRLDSAGSGGQSPLMLRCREIMEKADRNKAGNSKPST